MNYIIPSQTGFDGKTNKFVCVAGKYCGFYHLVPADTSINDTITPDQLYSGDSKLAVGNIVTIDNIKYTIKVRRVNKYGNWMFRPGALLLWGIQHDHYYTIDYNQTVTYKEHTFKDVEGWCQNQHFTPVFGMLIDKVRNNPKNYQMMFFELSDPVRNPLLDYNNTVPVAALDNVIHDINFCVEQTDPQYTIEDGIVDVKFMLNHGYPNQVVEIKPVFNTPINYTAEIDDQWTGHVKYRLDQLYQNKIEFQVITNTVSAGTIKVELEQ